MAVFRLSRPSRPIMLASAAISRPRWLTPTTLSVGLSAIVLVALALFGPLLLLGLLIAGAVVLAIVAQPKIGLYLAVLSVPVQDSVKAGGVTATQAAFVLLFGAWALGLLLRGAHGGWLRDANFWRFALFYAAILASLRVAGNLRLTLDDGFHWGEALVIFVIARDVLRTRRDWAALLACCCIGAAGEAYLGSVQSRLGLGDASFAVAAGLSRAFGTFGRPNSYAGYLEMTFPLALAVGLWAVAQLRDAIRQWHAARSGPLAIERRAARTLAMRFAVVAGLGLTAVSLFQGIGLSFSRGAWLGTAMAALAMMLLAGRRMARAAGIVFVVVALTLALGGAQALPDVLAKRLTSVTDSLVVTSIDDTPITDENFAVKERTAYWFGGLQMFRDNIFTGVGLGNYGPNYDTTYYSTPFLKSQVHAHNYYIHIAAETGIFGLLTYLLLIGGVLRTGVEASRRAHGDGFARALAIGGVGVVVAIAVHNFFEDLHVLSLGVHLSAIWGLLAAIRATYSPQAKTVKMHALHTLALARPRVTTWRGNGTIPGAVVGKRGDSPL